jgi:hypothetical protein
MKSNNYRPLVWLLFFGSVWGINEIVTGKVLYEAQVSHSSVWLTAWGFFTLAVARGMLNRPGYSSIIGGVAATLRMVNAASSVCHVFGIFLMGVAFDLAATLLIDEKRKIYLRSSLAGIVGAYGGYALFALMATYVFHQELWVRGGLPKVLDHILTGGSLVALISSVTVPLGYWIGRRAEIFVVLRSRWAYKSAAALTVIFWVLGGIARY